MNPTRTATRATTTGRRAVRGDEQGGAIVLVLVLGVLLLSFASIIVKRTGTETKASDRAAEYDGALHAAEAGVNDYIAKVTEDHLYYGHFVHPAEDTRTRPAGGTVSASNAWPGDPTWTYDVANRHQTWKAVGTTQSQYQYNLEVAGPGNSTSAITVTATGRRTGNPRLTRSIEVQFQGTSVAEFQMLSNSFIRYGTTAITNGKIYGLADVEFNGIANSGVYAEGSVFTTTNPAGTFNGDRCDDRSHTRVSPCKIDTVITTPVNFNTFSGSLAEVQRAAQSVGGGGIYLPVTAGVDAWRMTFNAAGTITIEKCTKSGNNDPASVAPSCVAYATKAVPTIGAIYASSDVIVRGTLKGRVTIVSNSDIAVDNNIDYTNGLTDVLGLIANGSIFVAQYAPNNLTWRAAVIARTGAVKLFDCGGPLKNGTMTVNGSLASFQSPCMATNSPATAGYTNRVYNFDDNLKFLQPPFYPVLEQAYKILRYREVDG